MHSGFQDPWVQLVACKDVNCRKGWHRNEAEVDLAIRNRILPSVSGKPLLKYFDGATMMLYQTPHKVFETIYCRKVPTPQSCIDLGIPKDIRYDVTWRDFEVKESTLKGAGLGLFTKVDIAKGNSIYFDDSPIMFPPTSLDTMEKTKHSAKEVLTYIGQYAEENKHLVSSSSVFI